MPFRKMAPSFAASRPHPGKQAAKGGGPARCMGHMPSCISWIMLGQENGTSSSRTRSSSSASHARPKAGSPAASLCSIALWRLTCVGRLQRFVANLVLSWGSRNRRRKSESPMPNTVDILGEIRPCLITGVTAVARHRPPLHASHPATAGRAWLLCSIFNHASAVSIRSTNIFKSASPRAISLTWATSFRKDFKLSSSITKSLVAENS